MVAESFVYCWTDHATNKLYIGWHKGSVDDGYVCSSKYMKEQYLNRPNDFTREIIATGSCKDMTNLETVLLRSADVRNDDQFYNRHNNDGFYRYGNHTEETKRKISKGNTNKPRPDLSERNKTDQNPAKLGLCGRDTSKEKNPMYGRNHTEETKEKIRNIHKGKKTGPVSEETRKRMSEARKKYWAERKKKEGKLDAY